MLLSIMMTLAVVSVSNGQDERVETTLTWPENANTVGGAIIRLSYPNLGNGTCIVKLPEVVNLFHVMNGFIVPDGSNPSNKLYKISAPTHWTLADGSFKVLIKFKQGAIFSLANISFECDSSDVSDINVYSFPQNILMSTASSSICFRPAFHRGDVLTVTFPVAVKRFNITSWDSDFTLDNEDNIVYTLTGFSSPFGNDFNTEVSFEIEYDSAEGVDNWFSAGDIIVRVDRAPTISPEVDSN